MDSVLLKMLPTGKLTTFLTTFKTVLQTVTSNYPKDINGRPITATTSEDIVLDDILPITVITIDSQDPYHRLSNIYFDLTNWVSSLWPGEKTTIGANNLNTLADIVAECKQIFNQTPVSRTLWETDLNFLETQLEEWKLLTNKPLPFPFETKTAGQYEKDLFNRLQSAVLTVQKANYRALNEYGGKTGEPSIHIRIEGNDVYTLSIYSYNLILNQQGRNKEYDRVESLEQLVEQIEKVADVAVEEVKHLTKYYTDRNTYTVLTVDELFNIFVNVEQLLTAGFKDCIFGWRPQGILDIYGAHSSECEVNYETLTTGQDVNIEMFRMFQIANNDNVKELKQIQKLFLK